MSVLQQQMIAQRVGVRFLMGRLHKKHVQYEHGKHPLSEYMLVYSDGFTSQICIA